MTTPAPPPAWWHPGLGHLLPDNTYIPRGEGRPCSCGETRLRVYRAYETGLRPWCRVGCPKCPQTRDARKAVYHPETKQLIRSRESAIGTYDARADVLALEHQDG